MYAAFLLMRALHALCIQQALQALLMQALQALCIQPLAGLICECAHRHCVSVTAISTAISRSRYPAIRTTLYTGISTSLYTATLFIPGLVPGIPTLTLDSLHRHQHGSVYSHSFHTAILPGLVPGRPTLTLAGEQAAYTSSLRPHTLVA